VLERIWGGEQDFCKFERIGTCVHKGVIFPLHVLLFQKADYLRQKVIPHVPDKLQRISAVAVSHGSMASVTGWDFYSQPYQPAFQTLSEGSTSVCLPVARNCKARGNPTKLSCTGSANCTGVSGRGVAAILQ